MKLNAQANFNRQSRCQLLRESCCCACVEMDHISLLLLLFLCGAYTLTFIVYCIEDIISTTNIIQVGPTTWIGISLSMQVAAGEQCTATIHPFSALWC